MASAILSSAKQGAYIAIGLYVALVLGVSLGVQYQGFIDTPLQASRPSAAAEHHASAEHGVANAAVGA
ncbi:hypothetical protein [Pseudomonas sp. Q11]|uniref:hypothetical protein n=1 Tax=Pseudomonas sp. Q11 TaxID=2968470 RepID=UPI00210DEEFD|nr:hypothetical protein [Pseudomonas sp. Q11]MCQ6254952.1 hypothetical protein [Pseudomonas sp. Q11]